MKKRIRFIIQCVVAIQMLIPHLSGQGGLGDLPPGKWWKERRFVDALRLSHEQQEKIESLWMQNRRNFIDLKAELDKRHLDLSDLLARDVVEETTALKTFEQMQTARAAIERTTFLMRVRIKNILSPEQQARLEEIAERLRRERNARPADDRIPRPDGPRPPDRIFDF